jgi:SAM-dependent methyltransferase
MNRPAAKGGYVYDQSWSEERDRLAGIEALWDEGTRHLLTSLGLAEGWTCLEVGGGGGAVVEWLCETVGASGRVLATDVDTRFLDALELEPLEVDRHDIVHDPLPPDTFDVAHARLVLEHLPERAAALDRMIASTRPGGWIVVEDYDWACFGIEPAEPAGRRGADATLAFMQQAGHDPAYGRRLVAAFAARGLADVRGEGRLRVLDHAHPGFAFFKLSFAALREPMVSAGTISAEDADALTAHLADREGRIVTPALIAAIGRKPAA